MAAPQRRAKVPDAAEASAALPRPRRGSGEMSSATSASWFLCGATQFQGCGSLDAAERGRKKWIRKTAARGNAGRSMMAESHVARSKPAESHAAHSRTARSGRCAGHRPAALRRSCSARWMRRWPRSACRRVRPRTAASSSARARHSRWYGRSALERRTARRAAVSSEAHPATGGAASDRTAAPAVAFAPSAGRPSRPRMRRGGGSARVPRAAGPELTQARD